MRETSGVLVVGAGMAGLMAAGALHTAGRPVTILDKGRGLGGRMATRRWDGATFDHGAPCLSLRHPEVRRAMEACVDDGTLVGWDLGRNDSVGSLPLGDDVRAFPSTRWRGNPSMSAIAKRLASGLDVRLQTTVTSIRPSAGAWRVETDAGDAFGAEDLILTAPVPQALAWLDAGACCIDADVRARLARIEYERCLTVMAILDGPTRIPAPGMLEMDDGPVARVTDGVLKGISAVPSVTIHASHGFSAEHWDRDRVEAGRILLDEAGRWVGAAARSYQVHGWRFSQPRVMDPEPCLVVGRQPLLVLAGDAFGDGGCEGAALSGLAAAAAVLAEG